MQQPCKLAGASKEENDKRSKPNLLVHEICTYDEHSQERN